MSSSTIQFELITNAGVLLKTEASYLSIPSVEGELGILPGHTPLIAQLTSGILSCEDKNKQIRVFAVHWGYIEVFYDKVTILPNLAEEANLIDLERAKIAQTKAEKLISEFDFGKAELDDTNPYSKLKVFEHKLIRSLTRQRAKEI